MLVSWQFFIPNLQEAANKLKFELTSNVSEEKEQWVFKNDRFSKVTDKGASKEVKIYDLDEKGNIDSIVVSKDIEIAENEWVIKEVRDYKEDISKSDFVWEDAPKLAMNYSDATADEMAALQDQIDAQNLWDLESQVEQPWMRCAARPAMPLLKTSPAARCAVLRCASCCSKSPTFCCSMSRPMILM